MNMRPSTVKADLLLLVGAAIWGFAFVAQRLGMNHVGPFTFNAARFLLGTLSLATVIWLAPALRSSAGAGDSKLWRAGFIAGCILFAGASFQQAGLVYTTAGKGGFITGLYLVIVPFLALAGRHKTPLQTWIGAVLALVGLYFLSITETQTIEYGDLLVLCSAFCWALHVIWIGRISTRFDPVRISLIQFFCCALLSLAAAMAFERVEIPALVSAGVPIAYAGVLSVGLAYTLQVVAQREAQAAHAALLMSLETVFAALGGWLILEEGFSARSLLGCGLMLTGMVISQTPVRLREKSIRVSHQ